MKRKNNKGFTLVELLVVIAIIGILAVVAVPSLFNNINKSKIAKLKSDLNAMKTSIVTFYAENNRLPANKGEVDGNMESKIKWSPFNRNQYGFYYPGERYGDVVIPKNQIRITVSPHTNSINPNMFRNDEDLKSFGMEIPIDEHITHKQYTVTFYINIK